MTIHKILFIDIDGPLVPERSFILPGNALRYWNWTFDPAAVAMLNFCSWADPDVRVVLASHRWGTDIQHPRITEHIDSLEFWKKAFWENGLRVTFHDDWITPRELDEKNFYVKLPKKIEIRRWLNNHPDVKHFVTIEDDLNGGEPVTHALRKEFNLVGEDYENGLSMGDFRLMCRKIGIQQIDNKYVEYGLLSL